MSETPKGPQKVDLKRLKPYGDIMGDGTIQICFTLPVEASAEAREAAVQLVQKMGLDQIKVATMENVGRGFSMFVIYANVKVPVDFTKIEVVKVEAKTRARDELDEVIKTHIGRKLVVLGACTGYDAHTVGIDAIMNMKGFAGDYGLERYQWLDARNLGAQVLNEELIKLAVSEKADAILVSKVVTQHNIHIRDLKDLITRAKKAGLMDRLIFVAGGPRVTHPLALECGFDAGFGVGTKPSDVASYIVEEFLRRRERLDGIPNPLRPTDEPARAKAPAKPTKKSAPKTKRGSAGSKLVVKFRPKKAMTTGARARKASPRRKAKK
ncbi:MAG: cobalamin-dependent protein [Bdellovibrionales bacterium]|nr:cobalamin-dependent protein [Bdellovibrionales bacterium]